MKISLKLCATLVITTAVAIATAKDEKFLANKPDFLRPCEFSDPNFNACFVKNIGVIYKEYKDGIPGYKSLGALDPLHVKRITIDQKSNGPLSVSAELINVIVTGFSTVDVQEARFDPKTLTSKIKMFIPKLRIDSDYKINGRVLNLVLDGKGKSFFEIGNLGILLNLKLKLREEFGHTFTDIEKLKMDITEISSFRTHFANLFNGQKDLEESANSLFNENWRDIYEILHPAISQAIQFLLTDRMAKAYGYLPADFFIKDLAKIN